MMYWANHADNPPKTAHNCPRSRPGKLRLNRVHLNQIVDCNYTLPIDLALN